MSIVAIENIVLGDTININLLFIREAHASVNNF